MLLFAISHQDFGPVASNGSLPKFTVFIIYHGSHSFIDPSQVQRCTYSYFKVGNIGLRWRWLWHDSWGGVDKMYVFADLKGLQPRALHLTPILILIQAEGWNFKNWFASPLPEYQHQIYGNPSARKPSAQLITCLGIQLILMIRLPCENKKWTKLQVSSFFLISLADAWRFSLWKMRFNSWNVQGMVETLLLICYVSNTLIFSNW